MKNIILTLLTLFCCFQFSNINAQGKLSLGMDGGARLEKALFNDPKEFLFRDIFPAGTIGLGGIYEYNHRWEFEVGVYRTTFTSNVSAYYNHPDYFTTYKYGNRGGGGFETLQVPLRAIYFSGLQYRRFSLNFYGGLVFLYQFESSELKEAIGGGSFVFPVQLGSTDPSPTIGMEYESKILNRTSIAFELGTELRYQLSSRFHMAYRFSVMQGTRDKVGIEGSYFVDYDPDVVYDFDVIQRGTSLNHFLSLRYRIGKKVDENDVFE